MAKLTFTQVNNLVYRVQTDQGDHVGNLKFINAVWKFKAIGYEENGDVIPGGGPLTDQHNMSFDTPDEAEIGARLGGVLQSRT